MLLATALGLFLAFWSLVFLIDFYIRTRNFTKYISFVERTGIVVSPCQVRWYTARFQSWLGNVWLLRCGWMRRFLSVWFGVGALVSVCTLGAVLVLLSRILWAELRLLRWRWWASIDSQTEAPLAAGDRNIGLIPVVPGVNVPWEQMPLFLTALVVVGVIHEFGHALAAINENVNVNGFGIFFIVIYPGAFTEIETDGLDALSLFRKLKIYCGGIWHNFVLAGLAVLLLWSLPTCLSSAYLSNKGVLVTEIDPQSGLHGPAGLRQGHVVYGINYCKVYNLESWRDCLSRLMRTNYGYCVPRNEVASARAARVRNIDGEMHCCGANATQTHLCFYYKAQLHSLNETRLSNLFEYSCLPARYVTDHYVCNQSLPCTSRATCVYPALFNSTKLMRFFVANHSMPVLFIGFPKEVAASVDVSSYVPRSRWLGVWLPATLELFLKYLITFSLALALLNAVPCYSLDGQFIMAVLLDAYVSRHRKWARRREFLYKVFLFLGSGLLAANITLALWKFAKPYLA